MRHKRLICKDFPFFSILFDFPFKQVFHFISEWNVSMVMVNGLWLSHWGRKIVCFFLERFRALCIEGKKRKQFWSDVYMWGEFWMENKQTWHDVKKWRKWWKTNDMEWSGMDDATKQKSIKTTLWFWSTVEYGMNRSKWREKNRVCENNDEKPDCVPENHATKNEETWTCIESYTSKINHVDTTYS